MSTRFCWDNTFGISICKGGWDSLRFFVTCNKNYNVSVRGVLLSVGVILEMCVFLFFEHFGLGVCVEGRSGGYWIICHFHPVLLFPWIWVIWVDLLGDTVSVSECNQYHGLLPWFQNAYSRIAQSAWWLKYSLILDALILQKTFPKREQLACTFYRS